MAGEGDLLHATFVVVIAIDVDPAGGAALFDPGGDVQRVAGAAAGLKVDRRPGELYIAAVGAELNAFDHPADGEVSVRSLVSLRGIAITPRILWSLAAAEVINDTPRISPTESRYSDFINLSPE